MFPESMTTDRRETAAVIALLRRGGRPWHHFADLVETAGSALAVLNGDFSDPDAVPAGTLFEIEATPEVSGSQLSEIEAEVAAWEGEGITVLSVLDAAYPANLRSVYDRPPLLFLHGEMLSEDSNAVAVVGTRRASDDGIRRAGEIASGLGAEGYTVLSGLAEGIDSAAHRAALAQGSRTVAVIGTGLRRFYPAKNRELQREIATRAAVVSQFWPDAPPTKRSFPMRNVVMSGLGLATVVVEASHTSGARMQARFALEHGRPVFLLSSLLEHQWARDYAARPGAYVVDSAAEVIDHVRRLTAVDTLVL